MARGKYKGPKRGAGQRNRDRPDEEEEDIFRRQGAGQGANAGKLPPSDSDGSDEEAPKEPVGMLAGMGAPGDLPPNSSDEEDDDSDSDDSDIQPLGTSKAKADPEPPRRRKKDEEDVDPAQIAKDMERLKLIREKREQQRLERLQQEGWDRYAPVTSSNKPPDSRPSDHPDFKK